MAIFAHIGSAGEPLGFYDTEIGAPPPFDDLGAALIEVSQEVRDAWIIAPWQKLADGVLIHDPAPLTKDQLLAHLAAHRWAVETGGIDLNGMTVATDDRSKTMIMGARIAAMADPSHIANWKMPDGSWAPLDAATITAISDAVLNHVNWCFARESEVVELITAGDITDYDGVEAAFDM